MPTPKNQTQIHPAQYEVIKELLVEPFMSDIIDYLYTITPQEQHDDVYLSLVGQNFFGLIQSITMHDKTPHLAATQLTQLWDGKVDLHTTFAADKPTFPVLRVALLQAIIETLHEQFPKRRITNPILESFPALDGMSRIRALFQQYITKTTSGSLERYKLALEILLEKEKLGLPSNIISTSIDITFMSGFAPGDFSYLDLSNLDLSRDDGHDGDFKKLVLHHSNCDFTNWSGLSLSGANFTDSSLRGANLSNLANNEDINFSQTDIEGAYFGQDYVVDRRAKNYMHIAQTMKQLTECQQQLRQQIVEKKFREQQAIEVARAQAEAKAKAVDKINITAFKRSYFADYNSGFFKNPRSTMKLMFAQDRIHSMTDVSQYVALRPYSRTARVYANLPLATVDNYVETEEPASACARS